MPETVPAFGIFRPGQSIFLQRPKSFVNPHHTLACYALDASTAFILMIVPRLSNWLPFFITFITLIHQTSPVVADADFESVRIRYDYPYMGGQGGDPKAKYWRESEIPLQSGFATLIGACRRVGVSAVPALD